MISSMIAVAAMALAAPPEVAPRALIKDCAAQVSAERLRADVDRLASFGTRHSLSDGASPTRGIGAARAWIRGELERAGAPAGGRMSVEIEEFDVPGGRRIPKGGAHLANVVGVLRGTSVGPLERRVYIVGHYDSRNAGEMDATGDAPGANDDASGTAAVIEAARVLCRQPAFPATIVFLATSGEEQGLLGAQYHAAQASARNETIIGVLSNDIIGDPALETGGNAGDVRVFSEGLTRNPSAERLAELRLNSAESDSPSRELARYVVETGALGEFAVRPRMVFRPDRFMRGGDHLAFNEAGFAAVRFTSSSEVYARQHANVTEKDGRRVGDLPEFVDAGYLAGVTRLNVATIARLAMAPPPPLNVRIVTTELGNSTMLRWDFVPDPRSAGFEVVWRATTEPTWTGSKDVGLSYQATLGMSKDDLFFGVRSVTVDGFRSPVVFAMSAKK
jgi:hypothetical protein